jgi:hypothetical protein
MPGPSPPAACGNGVKDDGLPHCYNGPHHAGLSDDVRYSLAR